MLHETRQVIRYAQFSLQTLACTKNMSRSALNFYDNEFHPSPQTLPISSPLDSKQIGNVHFGDDLVEMVVKQSHDAYLLWSSRTVKDRVQFLFKFRQLLVENLDEMAKLIMLEHGKTFLESKAEISKGVETLDYAISLPQLMSGNVMMVSRGVQCLDVRRPVGVCVSIVPFNFPFMVPMWTLPIAIACGNTMILKPSEKVPLTMSFACELMVRSGLPKNVVSILNGTQKVVEKLCDDPLVSAVTFVGTTRVAELIRKRCCGLNKRVLALGGAKNHLVAAPDCNVDMASTDIVNSFVGCSGQRCMAASVLLLIGEQSELVNLIVQKASEFTPGQGEKQMGPVIDDMSKSKIKSYIDDSEANGAKILLDGRSWLSNNTLSATGGNWIGPTVILHTNKADKALHDEIFGPVISIYVCQSKEEAIQIENGNPYGNAGNFY